MSVETGPNAPRVFDMWIDRADKLVSFHPVEGCQRMGFTDRESFLCEILSMAQAGYRFQ